MAETAQETADELREHTAAIIASGVLGRSRFYRSLLEYLVACAERGQAPKEVEIAADVFDRGEHFDPGQDSMVRVYIHNLRQKLDQYYQHHVPDTGRRLAVPKGEYRVVLQNTTAVQTSSSNAGSPATPALRRLAIAALVIAGIAAGILIGRSTGSPADAPADYRDVAASPFWAGMLDDELPIALVTGDYYIFGELDERGEVDRLVREFAINSRRDLDDLRVLDATIADRYMDLDLTYLPTSAGSAIRDILRIVYTTDKQVQVVAMSDLDAMDIREHHIVYVGYLSALDKLFDFVFMASELAIGDTFDELVDMVSGASFRSEAGIPTGQRNYRDYGLVSRFPGPNGNEMLILAGTRDEGLMHSALSVSDPGYVAAGVGAVAGALGTVPVAYEILYEVAGFDRTNLDASIVHIAELPWQAIWTGEFGPPR